MTTIVVTAAKTLTLLPTGIAGGPGSATNAGTTSAVVTDNSGAVLATVSLNGSESPPWSATLTGAAGTQEASVTFQDLDNTGAPLGVPVTVTETGSGGQPGTFQATTGGTISVTP